MDLSRLSLLCLAAIFYKLVHAVLFDTASYEDQLRTEALLQPRGKLYLVEDVVNVKTEPTDLHKVAG